jgi:hypothetical protein
MTLVTRRILGYPNFTFRKNLQFISLFVLLLTVISCTKPAPELSQAEESVPVEQSAVQDDESQVNIMQTAIASPDHTTLVTVA